ncbi:thiol-disulfide isomerase-like thioredoxin [Thioflavicoccus mobilis 8321]|uniref:Thiol-disulfide isomerase-like thioredoxin n=1 Tax=Thioflavicoccus mobilis 8321 TaxID=765912 RepID=L0GQN8_9GAMM|nr:TlpA disulfide reductase family protein [Thioflavicoccus mobilis]AGA89053.1 thiol-disulfide isomerase-like thioredoxin [Thioflavicoccus mobilis 8321]
MSAVKTVSVTLLAGVLSIGIAVLGERWFGDEESPRPPRADREGLLDNLPSVQWTDLAGRTLESADWTGEPVVLHYWATWCPVCREQLTLLAEAQRRHGDASLRVVGIAIDRREDLERFLAENRVDYPVVLGDPEAMVLARRLGDHLQGVPFLVLFDRSGRRVFARTGAFTATELDRLLGQVLGQDAPSRPPGAEGSARIAPVL